MKPRNVYEEMCLVTLIHSVDVALVNMYDSGIHMEDGAALLATSIGQVLGRLQIEYEMHAESCDVCSKRKPDFLKTFIREFSEAYEASAAPIRKRRDEGKATADDILNRVFKGEGK